MPIYSILRQQVWLNRLVAPSTGLCNSLIETIETIILHVFCLFKLWSINKETYVKLITVYVKLMSLSLIFALLQVSFLAQIVKEVCDFLCFQCLPLFVPWSYEKSARYNETRNLTYIFIFIEQYFIKPEQKVLTRNLLQEQLHHSPQAQLWHIYELTDSCLSLSTYKMFKLLITAYYYFK